MPDDPDCQPGVDDPLDSTQWAAQTSASNGVRPVQRSLLPFDEACDPAYTNLGLRRGIARYSAVSGCSDIQTAAANYLGRVADYTLLGYRNGRDRGILLHLIRCPGLGNPST